MSTVNVTVNDTRTVMEKHMRRPHAHVKVFTSGKLTAYGCATPQDAYVALRRAARTVQRIMFRQRHARAHQLRLVNFRVCNVMATTRLPFGMHASISYLRFICYAFAGVDLSGLHTAQAPITEYEPELSTGVLWRVRTTDVEGRALHATLRIQHTGSIVVTGWLL